LTCLSFPCELRLSLQHREEDMRNSRRGAVDPFIVMDVMEQARAAEAAGRHVIHMEVGQPGTPAPQGARDALAQAMQTDAL
jgi:aspartate/methionine/tyrosine aminotransferase